MRIKESVASEDRLIKTDVLVVGGGGAGMRAAIAAAARGADVFVANKGPMGRSGTTPMAMEAYQAVCLPGDSEEIHFRDTVAGGWFLGDENLIEVLVRGAFPRARDLETFGVRFKKKPDGSYDPMHHPGQTFPRALFVQGGGFGMLSALVNRARKDGRISTLSDVQILRLLPDREGGPTGAVCLDLKDGNVKAVTCGAVVIATGGYEELWAWNDAACTACGDGVFLAYEAGAELMDLEMLQFYPTVVIHPPYVKGTLFQYELVINPEFLGGRLCNGRGETFFEGLPLRDAVTRAIWGEIKAGRGTEHGGVYIDLTRSTKDRQTLTAALEKWQPNQFHYLKEMGFDLRDVRVEVAPHAHFTMGGVAIDEKGATTVPGLFAAGEAAGNLHGANRVSGNALAETQVFGALAGAAAAAFAQIRQGRPAPGVQEAVREIEAENRQLLARKESSLRPFQILRSLQETMWKRCGVERDEAGMRQGKKEIDEIGTDLLSRMSIYSGETHAGTPYLQELQQAWELKMMAALSDLVLTSALFRKETRGHHMRTDYPGAEENPRHVLLSREKEPAFGAVKRISK